MLINNKLYVTIDTVDFMAAYNQGYLHDFFDHCCEGIDTLRYSLDNALFIVKTSVDNDKKWLKDTLKQYDINYKEYSWENMWKEVQKPTWTTDY